VWMAPNDDEHTTRFVIYAMRPAGEDANRRFREYFERYASYDPAAHYDDLFYRKRYPPQEDVLVGLTAAQDYVSIRGQGRITDRSRETLGRSDLGIVTLRRIFWRELDALRAGAQPKRWRRRAEQVELPTQPGALAVPGEAGV